ncbi:MAG: DUF3598 family protein [Vulcanococcus sp.]
MTSQWQNFLRNLGEWRGTFSSINLDGELVDCTASILSLEAAEEDRLVRFRLRRWPTAEQVGEPSRDVSEDYRSLGRQVVFFESGSFCKGTLQVSPGTAFGGEFGFVDGDRRHRLVQLHNDAGSLETLLLIREFRAGSNALEQPALQPVHLLGTWQGKAATISADWPEPDRMEASLTALSAADGAVQLRTTIGALSSDCVGRIQWLPDAGYHLSPLQVSHRAPFAVQAGWLPEPGRLECLIRRFDGTGAWQSSTQLQLRRD